MPSTAPPGGRALTNSTSVEPRATDLGPAELGGPGGRSLHEVRVRVETRVRDLGASLFDRLVSEVLDEAAWADFRGNTSTPASGRSPR